MYGEECLFFLAFSFSFHLRALGSEISQFLISSYLILTVSQCVAPMWRRRPGAVALFRRIIWHFSWFEIKIYTAWLCNVASAQCYFCQTLVGSLGVCRWQGRERNCFVNYLLWTSQFISVTFHFTLPFDACISDALLH